ncbi:hypothetical protein [Brevibacillus borstelensis]|uniref:hypothetical protein n=1 Tax=Brevibacillus borstelensis TaxID=45462 RepID=UPI0030C22A11
MNSLRSCAPFCDSLGIIAERTVSTSMQDEDRSGDWKQASPHRSRFPVLVVEQALVEEMKKEKTAPGSVGHCAVAGLSGCIPKAKPRPKAADSRKRIRVGR